MAFNDQIPSLYRKHEHTESEIQNLVSDLASKSPSDHNHNEAYESKNSVQTHNNSLESHQDIRALVPVHNTDSSAHQDIRDQIHNLTDHTHPIANVIELQDTLNSKVDKVEGMGLSVENYTTVDRDKLASLFNFDATNLEAAIALKADATHTHEINDISLLQVNLSSKVDKVEGMGLSVENYTTVDRDKLASLFNFDATNLEAAIALKADATHTHEIEDITLLQDTLSSKVNKPIVSDIGAVGDTEDATVTLDCSTGTVFLMQLGTHAVTLEFSNFTVGSIIQVRVDCTTGGIGGVIVFNTVNLIDEISGDAGSSYYLTFVNYTGTVECTGVQAVLA